MGVHDYRFSKKELFKQVRGHSKEKIKAWALNHAREYCCMEVSDNQTWKEVLSAICYDDLNEDYFRSLCRNY